MWNQLFMPCMFDFSRSIKFEGYHADADAAGLLHKRN